MKTKTLRVKTTVKAGDMYLQYPKGSNNRLNHNQTLKVKTRVKAGDSYLMNPPGSNERNRERRP